LGGYQGDDPLRRLGQKDCSLKVVRDVHRNLSAGFWRGLILYT
jgi:hypothetical protein